MNGDLSQLSDQELVELQGRLKQQERKQFMDNERKEAKRVTGVGDEGVLDSFLIGTGKAISDVGTSAQQIYADVTGDVKEQKRLKDRVAFERKAMSEIGSPIAGFLGEIAPSLIAPGGAALKGLSLAKSGAIGGAVAGFAAPIAEGEYRSLNTLMGAGLGAGVGKSVDLGIGAYNAIPGLITKAKSGNMGTGIKPLWESAEQESINSLAKKSLSDMSIGELTALERKTKQLESSGLNIPAPILSGKETVLKRQSAIFHTPETQQLLSKSNDELNEGLAKSKQELLDVFGGGGSEKQILERSRTTAQNVLNQEQERINRLAEPLYDAIKGKSVNENSKVFKDLQNNHIVQSGLNVLQKDAVWKESLRRVEDNRWKLAPGAVKEAQQYLKQNASKINNLDNLKTEAPSTYSALVDAKKVVDDFNSQTSVFKYDLLLRQMNDVKASLYNSGEKAKAKLVGDSIREVEAQLAKVAPEIQQARATYRQLHQSLDDLENLPLGAIAQVDPVRVQAVMTKLIKSATPEEFASTINSMSKLDPALTRDFLGLYLRNAAALKTKVGDDALTILNKMISSPAVLKRLMKAAPDADSRRLIKNIGRVLQSSQNIAGSSKRVISNIPLNDPVSRNIASKALNLEADRQAFGLAKLILNPKEYGKLVNQVIESKKLNKQEKLGRLSRILRYISGLEAQMIPPQ